MKTILLFGLFILGQRLMAQDLSSIQDILDRANISIEDIKSKDMTLKLGEVTGGGKSSLIKDVDSFITEDELIRKNEILKINSNNSTVDTLISIQLKDRLVEKKEIIGLIVKNK